MKLSAAKATAPGAKQVFRRSGAQDVIGLREEAIPEDSVPLLRPFMTGGHHSGGPRPLAAMRAAYESDLADLPPQARRIHDPKAPTATVSERLRALTDEVRHRIETDLVSAWAKTGREDCPAQHIGALHRDRDQHEHRTH
jgi:nicotinate phosphoribosyltransferase